MATEEGDGDSQDDVVTLVPTPLKRGKREPKLNAERQLAYCEEVARTGRLVDSCAAAGVCFETVALRRKADPQFDARVKLAEQAYHNRLLKAAHERAVDGWKERGIFDKDGTEIGEVRKYSDMLLALLLKKGDPSLRDNVNVTAVAAAGAKAEADPLVNIDLSRLDRAGRDALRLLLQQLGQPPLEVNVGSSAEEPTDANGSS